MNDDAYFGNLQNLLYPQGGVNVMPDSYPKRDGSGTITRTNEADDLWKARLEAEGWAPGQGAGGGGGQPAMSDVQGVIGIGMDIFDSVAPLIAMGVMAEQGLEAGRISELQQHMAALQGMPPQQASAEAARIQAEYAAEIARLRELNARQSGSFWSHPATIAVGGIVGLGLFGTLLTLMVRRMGQRNPRYVGGTTIEF